MGLIVKRYNHVGNEVNDVYVNLKNVILSNEMEEQEVTADDGSSDVIITRVKVWKRVAIFFVYISQDAALAGIEPIGSYKLEFPLDDFFERDVISIKGLFEQLIAENFEGTEIIHV